MKKCVSFINQLIAITTISAGIVCFGSNPASAYTIDGSLTDWNINLSAALNKGYLDINLPSGGWDIDVITEDNADIYSISTNVGPGWSTYNRFDAEAMYFDNDQENAYIAIITGLRKTGFNNLDPGDIAIDVDGINGYEYGIDVDTGNLYSVETWKDAIYSWTPIDPNPWVINTWYSNKGKMDFVYSNEQYSHYVLEARIPLNLLGLSANHGDPTKQIKIHWGMECGNDYLNLTADVNPVTPEPTTFALLGLGLLGLAELKRKKI